MFIFMSWCISRDCLFTKVIRFFVSISGNFTTLALSLLLQERVFAVLQAALPIDAPKVAKKALAVRSTHRDPVFIDQLVAAANRAP